MSEEEHISDEENSEYEEDEENSEYECVNSTAECLPIWWHSLRTFCVICGATICEECYNHNIQHTYCKNCADLPGRGEKSKRRQSPEKWSKKLKICGSDEAFILDQNIRGRLIKKAD